MSGTVAVRSVLACFALPLLLVLATLRSQVVIWLRRYAVANLLLFVVAALLLSGATGVDPTANEGVLQRVLALAVFPPVAVVSVAALREPRTGRTASESRSKEA